MITIRQIFTLTINGLQSQLRDRQLVFWNYGFFLMLMTLFIAAFGRDASVRVILVSGIVTIGVMATALFSVGIGMAASRDRGVYRRLSMFPVPPSTFLWGSLIPRWFIACSSAAIQVLVARFLFGVLWPGGLATWLVGLAAGAAAFCGIGFAIAGLSFASFRANAYVNALFVPMLILSGAALPLTLLPAWLLPVCHVLPSTALVDVLQGAFIRGENVQASLPALQNLLAWTAGSGLLGAIAWRRRGLN